MLEQRLDPNGFPAGFLVVRRGWVGQQPCEAGKGRQARAGIQVVMCSTGIHLGGRGSAQTWGKHLTTLCSSRLGAWAVCPPVRAHAHAPYSSAAAPPLPLLPPAAPATPPCGLPITRCCSGTGQERSHSMGQTSWPGGLRSLGQYYVMLACCFSLMQVVKQSMQAGMKRQQHQICCVSELATEGEHWVGCDRVRCLLQK